MEKATKYIRCI